MKKILKKYFIFLIPAEALLGLIVSGTFFLNGHQQTASVILEISLVVGVLPLIYQMLAAMFAGNFGVDLVAVTAIGASFFLHQYLAGTVIVLMMSGGEALEEYAMKRASKELTSLLARAPQIAHKKNGDQVQDLPVNSVKVNDILIVKPGEQIPVDGIVISGISEVDEANITGESLPVEKQSSSQVLSGTVNKNGILEIGAVKEAGDSQYQRIIQLVREAQTSKAPIVRLADRYAVWFTIITFILAIGSWFFTHDPIRFLAVLVVATPCPLILATPIAVMSGISWAASRGIIVKSGGSLEKLGQAQSFVFDKTGTLTLGIPKVKQIINWKISKEEVLKIAASLDQLSTHILARSLIRYAKTEQKIALEFPENFQEFLGDGVSGNLSGKKYYFGKLSFLELQNVVISSEVRSKHLNLKEQGSIEVYLADQKDLIGVIQFSDQVRSESKKVFQDIRAGGVKKIIMMTGDKEIVARRIAGEIGLSDYAAGLLPEDKALKVKELQRIYPPVVMIGDGVNDAPALASADVGIAMGIHGATAAAHAGDIVITVNALDRVSEAYFIARRVLLIAKQSIFVGMGLSIGLMIVAAFGFIRPVEGALLQEVLDVGVILNALRVHLEKNRSKRLLSRNI